MVNNFVLIGRYKALDIIDHKHFIITVNKQLKNEDEKYESYDLKIFSSEDIINNMIEYVKAGDLMGIKGRIEKDGKLFAEKLTFLSSSK